MERRRACLDGNEAAARVAYALSEVIPIYPITPASPMSEACDNWAAAGRPNLWGLVPDVIEMQSEAGAAGVLHGALQKSALGTTFTASQGLLLMVPSMFKIAGELTPTVIHVAARSIATHALSIFGDHMDVMHARSTGWAMLCSSSVQEAHDLALVSHIATLRTRVPFLHFFDGFRTSHEIDRVTLLSDDDLRRLVPEEEIVSFRTRCLEPHAPVVRGTAQNPDVYFQEREAANPFYLSVPEAVAATMREFAEQTGRQYGLVEYVGAQDAERAIALMGSAAGAAEEAVETLMEAGERVGLVKVRLFRPFPSAELAACLPPSVKSLAVLDRTKEPGSVGEPLYLDVLAALTEQAVDGSSSAQPPRIVGGRYGLSSKEFRPELAAAVFDELTAHSPRPHFTLGIHDDVTHLSVEPRPDFHVARPSGQVEALFFGVGSDGTVGASKSSVKIIGESTDLWAQGYFEYDSRKSGSLTISHLRFGPEPIRSTYLVREADFVACHQWGLLERIRTAERTRPGGVFLLNSPYPAEGVWQHLPGSVQRTIRDRQLQLWVIDAYAIADELEMGSRINTIMQSCFFQLSGVLPADEAIARIKDSVEKAYGRRGPAIVERNHAAIDRSLAALSQVAVPQEITNDRDLLTTVPDDAPEFVREVTARLLAGAGDELPVSALPPDGTFPTGTMRYEKRSIAKEIPIWDPEVCIQCAKCATVCPHATIRMKVYPPGALEGAPASFKHVPYRFKEMPGHEMTIQVAPDDCTGCGSCVDVCPGKSKTEVRHKAINMLAADAHKPDERVNWGFFTGIPRPDRTLVDRSSVRGVQLLQPLFEFPGACAGCGETPYIRLLSQLFGDRIVLAGATGCSSIYSSNLPTAAWTVNADGRGPAYNNSLFEDAAEFGLGLRMGYRARVRLAALLLDGLRGRLDAGLVDQVLSASQQDEQQIAAQRHRVRHIVEQLGALRDQPTDERGPRGVDLRHFMAVATALVSEGTWIIGGDGWAYDIGFGGVDHVLAMGRKVNLLVLDTEVYSNTGGQMSKATSRAAVAKFAAGGKAIAKKDLGAIARAYGNVYVAQVALGANEAQAIRALLEADAWHGPSLVIAYSTCVAHGIDMSKSMTHQKDAVRSGYWPLYRFQPTQDPEGQPFKLDSKPPSVSFEAFASTEARFAILKRTDPERASRLMALTQADIMERWRLYEQLAAIERTAPKDLSVEPEVESDAGYRYDQEDLRWAV